jgi:hypothetical protein
MYRPLFSLLLLAAPALVQAGPNDVCEVMLSVGCAQGCYRYVHTGPVIEANCDDPKMVIIQDTVLAAPANPSLDCKVRNGAYDCEAWPQSEDISYAWIGQQPGFIATDSTNPFQTFSCAGGQVSVAVIGPGGNASVATVTLPACN